MRVPPEKTFDASALWVWIDKLGSNEKRPLGIPTVRDRVVQTALAYVLPVNNETMAVLNRPR